MTVGIVCAEDANQTVQDTLELTDTQDVLSNTSEKSYDDLFSEIDKSDDSITLENDYKFKETDKINHILFTTNYTINGNNHVIDADGKTSMFKVSKESTLTLKNLILKNTNDSAIILTGATLITENVTFINTNAADYGGAVYCSDKSTYNSINDRFIDNTAPEAGSAIFGKGLSNINIDNATFTNKKPIKWSMIYGSDCFISVTNSVFANATSKYATAIYNTGFGTTIKKSKFINLVANITAGAVAIKGGNTLKFVSLVIDDSEFINITAAKNAGAVFADINGDGDNCDGGVVKINNTLFDKNSAEFGGAILQLGGTLDIANSIFTNNVAKENGGAIYTSNATVVLNKNTFTNNKANKNDGYGGAVLLDYETANVDECTFTDNIASEGGAIYSHSTLYKIKNSQFKNNTKDDIYTRFDDEGSNITDCGEYAGTINDKRFNYTLRYNGEKIILNPQPISGSAKDKYFNLNDLGLVTPVKNQGSMGSCWAFGAAGAFESSFLIATGIELDISENNIQNLGLRYSPYGRVGNIESGNLYMTSSYFVSWLGAANTSDDTYDELGKISTILYAPDNAYRTVNAVYINMKDKNAIKQYLTTYGALSIFVYGASSDDPSYSPKYNSTYNSKYDGNHYVTLVGWDDNFSKNNFTHTPEGDGAWICKNSWGTDWGDGGYYYLSYYDKSLTGFASGFTFDNVEHYETLYQNELSGISGTFDYDTYGQIYKSESGDIIAAVGTYFEEAKTPYTIKIFLNDRPVYTQSGKSTHAGYETIKLNQYIAVDPNSTFEIRIKSSAVPYSEGMRTPIVTGVNYMIVNGKFVDLSTKNVVAPIKAYTYHSPVITKDVVKYFDDKETVFTVYNVSDVDTIQASFNNKNYTIQITNGTGNISLGVLPTGEYLVTVTYHNQTFSSAVIVKTTLFTNDEKSMTIAYNAKSPTFGVQFLDSNGKPLNNTNVTFKFDNKSYTQETDAKGIYEYPINPKSKIGKHYIDYVNPVTGEKLRVTINIVSRFVGNKNVNMYYYDGHTYKVRVRDDNGQFVGKNQVVTIKIGKKTYKVKTNKNGYATLKIPSKITPGKYTIKATYKGQTVKNKLTVKQVLKTKKTVTVKKSAKKLVLSATLKKGKTAIKSKIVKFKVNGKTYKGKTNKKGIAKVTIKKAAINKLKVKKYTIKVSYLYDAVKSTLKVRR